MIPEKVCGMNQNNCNGNNCNNTENGPNKYLNEMVFLCLCFPVMTFSSQGSIIVFLTYAHKYHLLPPPLI